MYMCIEVNCVLETVGSKHSGEVCDVCDCVYVPPGCPTGIPMINRP